MNQHFLVRIEQQGRVSYQPARGQRQAQDLARAYGAGGQSREVTVLDAAGRVIWQAIHRADT